MNTIVETYIFEHDEQAFLNSGAIHLLTLIRAILASFLPYVLIFCHPFLLIRTSTPGEVSWDGP